MRKSKIMVSLKELDRPESEPAIFSAAQAAQYFGLDFEYFVRKMTDGVFKINNIQVERITPLKKKSGTKIRRDDGQEWDTIKECVAEIGAKIDQVRAQIRAKQCFDFQGHHYEALNYKEIHHVHTKPKRKRVKEIEMLNKDKPTQDLDSTLSKTDAPTKQEIIETLDYEVKDAVKQLSTEDKCFQLLQKLAIERIQNTEYDKASKVLSALNILSE